MCCSSSRRASIPTPRSPTCAPRSTTPRAIFRATPTSRRSQEVNLSLFPVLVVSLGGDVPERTLLRLARQARDRDRAGARRASTPTCAAPATRRWRSSPSRCSCRATASRSTSSSRPSTPATAWSRPARSRASTGRFAVKVPSLIETPDDILNFPIAVSGDAAVTLGDVAEVRPTFKDPTSITPRQRQAGDRHRGVEAHRREPDRDGRRHRARWSRR